MKQLQKVTEEIRPDLLLGFSHHAIKPVSVMARKMGIPSAVKLFGVMHLARTDIGQPRRWWLNFDQVKALRYPVDGYIVLNDGTQGDRALERHGIEPEKISFLPNGMDMEWTDIEIDRDGIRERYGLPKGRVLIVTVSRLVRLKRIDALLKATASMDGDIREKTAVVIAGDGPERGRLESMAESLGIGDRTFFIGPLKYDEVAPLLKASDMFAATSNLTNMSMPPCEALLCGIPVVAYDVAGTSEVVQGGRTGILVGNGKIGDMAAALERLVDDPELRDKLGAGAAAFAREHFMSWNDRISIEYDLLSRLTE
jgi:glycosyltransferase involved in cell wall biosynthesis